MVCLCCFAFVALFCVHLCRCLAVLLVVKVLLLALHHHQCQKGHDTHLKSQTVRDLSLPYTFRLSLAFFRTPPLWWSVLFSLIPIPRIFADNDWTDLFGNFKDLSDRLIKECYSNARFTGVEL